MNRREILVTADTLTSADRHKVYGDANINMACAKELKRIFWQYYGQNTSKKSDGPAFEEGMDMVITKLSRIACGAHKGDNFVDGVGYLALAGEAAERHLGLDDGFRCPDPNCSDHVTFGGEG